MPWYLRASPGWVAYLLVPIYAVCVAILHQQKLGSPRVIGMILFASCTHLATAAGVYYLSSRSDIIAAIGALTIGILGNLYSRTTQGSAFVMMVPSVLFLVPVSDLIFYLLISVVNSPLSSHDSVHLHMVVAGLLQDTLIKL
jgi:uncharacterized membrane protein YjjB (DUF3815 family)